MHELSIALSILDIGCEQSHRHCDAEVLAVHVKIGQMSGVVVEALLFSFEIAREDTPLCRAELKIEEVPVMIFCPTCEQRQPVASIQSISCRECGTLSSDITQGGELEVVAIELAAESAIEQVNG